MSADRPAAPVTMHDLRISPQALLHQAAIAERSGRPQLGENLRRAAELAEIDDDELLELYESLRPRRASYQEMLDLAAQLRRRGMPRCATLVEDAADAYRDRRLTRCSSTA